MRDNKITVFQNTSLLILASFIFQIILMPLLTTGVNGPTAWISIVIAMLIGFLFVKPICNMQIRHKDKTILDICHELLPTFIVKIIGIFYIALFIFASSILLKDFSEQVKMFMLPNTHNSLIIMIILITSSYATQKGISTIAQVAHLTVLLALIPLLLVTVFSTANASITNVLPLWPLDYMGIIKTVPIAFGSFFGFYMLLFSNPYARRFRDNAKQNWLYFLLSGLLFILCFLLVIVKFGQNEAGRLMFPFAQILKFVNLPGMFLENFEALGISLTVICGFVCLSVILYFANLSFKKTIKTQEDGYFIFIQAPIIYVVSCLLPGMNIVLKYIYIPIYIFSAINILILLILIVVDKKRSMAK